MREFRHYHSFESYGLPSTQTRISCLLKNQRHWKEKCHNFLAIKNVPSWFIYANYKFLLFSSEEPNWSTKWLQKLAAIVPHDADFRMMRWREENVKRQGAHWKQMKLSSSWRRCDPLYQSHTTSPRGGQYNEKKCLFWIFEKRMNWDIKYLDKKETERTVNHCFTFPVCIMLLTGEALVDRSPSHSSPRNAIVL